MGLSVAGVCVRKVMMRRTFKDCLALFVVFFILVPPVTVKYILQAADALGMLSGQHLFVVPFYSIGKFVRICSVGCKIKRSCLVTVARL